MKDNKNIKEKLSLKGFWISLFFIGVALIIFYKTVDKLPSVFAAIGEFIGILTPIIFGIVISFLLFKPVSMLEEAFEKSKLKFISAHSRCISVLICYLALFVILGFSLYLVLPKVIMSIFSLVDAVPEYYNSVMKFLENKAGADDKIFGFDIKEIKSYLNVETILSYFDFSTITKYAGELFKATGKIIDFFLSIVISVYLLLGREHLINVLGRIFRIFMPSKKVLALRDIVFRSSKIFYNYLYSQLIDAVIVAVICTVIFSLANIPYAFLLAVLMGICNIVPYFGALIGGFGVVFITLLSTGDIVKALVALVLVIGAQQLDANIIQPRIIAESVGIKPIYVLLAITVGSGLFGFFGIILAVPVVAIIRMLILEYIKKKESLNVAEE